MADGGATYTVNIELATRQFSQDLRNLKNKIQRELGKSVKVATGGGTGANSTSKERALAIRKEQYDNRERRRIKYNADQTRAQLIEKQRLIERINKLQSFGYKDSQVKKLRDWAGEIDSLARGNPQAAQQKIKDLRGALDLEDKILQTIINQGLEKEKQAKQQIEQSRKIENRRRKGPHGQRMHGPIDIYGNDIYDPGKRVPAIPKSGASLPIDLQRKGTGTFATSHTRLLRRRQNLETILSTFDGISNPEINNFKKGIQGLVKQYGAISTSMGQTKNASGFGNAGEIGRQLKELDNLTHREEQRAKRIQVTNKQELEILNDKHRVEKVLARLDKKGVNTTSKRLQLEKAITAQDKQQLKELLRQVELENIGLKGVSGTGRVSSKSKGTPYSVFNQNSPYFSGKSVGGRGARVAQSALISGGFPLLFGQNPLVAGLGAAGGALGESLSPGGGFAGGIAATAISTVIGGALTSVKNLSEALNPLKFNADKAVEALGFLNSARAREIKLIEKTRGSNAALLEVRKDIEDRYGASALESLDKFDSGWSKFMKGFKSSLTGMKINFAEFVDSVTSDSEAMKKLGLTKGKNSSLIESYNNLTKQIELASAISGPNLISQFEAGNVKQSGFMGSSVSLTRKGKANVASLKAERDKLIPGLVAAGIDVKSIEVIGKYNAKMTEQIGMLEYNLSIEKRILELREQGINPAIAKTMVTLEQMNDASIDLMENKAKALETDIQGMDVGDKDYQTKLTILEKLREEISDTKVLNKLKIDGIVADIKTNKEKERHLALYKEIGTAIRTGLVQVLQDAFDKTKSINEAMNKLINSISDKLLDYGMSYLLANSGLPGAKKFFGFANGGRPPVGRPSVVGEKGPELFVPDSAGTVVPNHAMGGASVVVNVDASGSQVQGDEGQAAILGRAISTAVTEEIARQKRPGGLLSA